MHEWTHEPSDEKDPGVLQVLRRRVGLVAACCLLVAGAALGFSLIQTNQYSATASLLFRDPGFDQRLFGSSSFQTVDPAREAATNVKLVSLAAVADRTARDLDEEGLTGSVVSEHVAVQAEGASNVVSVTATDPDPEFAAILANAFAANYTEFRRDADRKKVAQAIRLVRRDYEQLPESDQEGEEGLALQRQISQLQTLEALQTGNAELVQRAEVPTDPSSPRPVRNTIVGGILGLLLGMGLALLFERSDRRLRDPDELESTFSLPVLARVPESKDLESGQNGAPPTLRAGDAEAFRMLRTRLLYFNVDRAIESVLVTSPGPQDGKSTISWNFARAAAESGSRTLLLEVDFHRPTVAERRDLAPLPGLAELLTGQASLESVIQKVPMAGRSNGASAEHHLAVIVAGATPPNPAQLLESKEMRHLVDELRSSYDLLVIDTPPATLIADAIPLMRLVDGVIVVAALTKTTRDEAVHLRNQLRELDVPVLGVVANRVRRGRGYHSYQYGYAEKTTRRLQIGRRG